jgi:leucine-rich repeat-containing G protein-coupled receptor 6
MYRNLGENIFPALPTGGLQRLLHLKTFNNPRLRIFPPIEAFPRIRTLVLSYAYHCCAFLPLLTSNTKVIESPYKEEVFFPTDEKFDMSMWNNSINDIWPDLNMNFSNAFLSQMDDILQSYSNPYADFGYPSMTNYPDGSSSSSNDLYSGEESSIVQSYESSPTLVKCLPTPGPFLPCEDLFDWWTLRCGVWVVFLLALLGNGIVVFVLIFSRSKMDVPRFLVCNLAAADFFMGIYLGFLAVVDASTLGEFRMYAIRWQMSVGCQLSGFLAVLSSELSVYTLAVITLERNYAITHAMHLNKRLSLRHASYIMSVGWLFALTMAVLPLFGVSDYRKFSVCLPMEVYKGHGSLTYVIFLMFINGVAFLTLMGCYLKMYCAIRGSQAWNSNDSRIAKRMALLVFTDFLCWSPIAFFSIATVLGWQLVTLEQAKVFTVFILPLNSCCNPFLYAILTKQFKKDCVMLCKAIEESRVTRGIGRCRHSSNFSNRQTPGNTNSLNERSSREMPPLLPAHVCNCNRGKVIDQEEVKRQLKKSQPSLMARFWKRLFCSDGKKFNERRNHRHMDYSYHIAEIKQKNHKRAGSMSSSDGNFSSSRSDSWKHGTPHHCGVPLRLLDPRRRHTSWLITRKTSQDSNLSSSRNDSSGSNNTTATTASTSTWRISRSSGSNIVIPGLNIPPFTTSSELIEFLLIYYLSLTHTHTHTL